MLTEVTQIYAMSIGGIVGLLLLVNTVPYLQASWAFAHRLTLQHLVFPQLLPRNRYLGPWSRAGVLLQAFYIAANVFCLSFGAASLDDAGVRAAHLSLINIAPAFAGPHLSFLADILGVSLQTFRRAHRSAGILSVMLVAFHVTVVVAHQTSFPLQVARNMGALVGAASLCTLLVLSLPVLRRFSYELFLRTHQTLALLSLLSIWCHLWHAALFPRLMIYIVSITFLSMLALQLVHMLYKNKAMGMDVCRAYIACTGDAVKIRLILSRHIKVEAGQYVGLCIPAAGFCAFQQSHPFTVVSWSEGKQKHLDFLLEPRKGITRKLLELGKANHELRSTDEVEDYMVTRNLKPHLAWFSGPHGPSVSIGDYETVLMIASDFGIASQLPYLLQLIYGYKHRKTHNLRIHLVWHLHRGMDLTAAHLLLNSALRDDAWHDGYILSISIYDALGEKREDDRRGKRVVYHYAETPDFVKILEEEKTYEAIEVQNVTTVLGQQRKKMAVLVSATSAVRDEIRKVMRSHVKKGVELFELEYQPA